MIKGVVLNLGSNSPTICGNFYHVDYLSPNLCDKSSEKAIGMVGGMRREGKGERMGKGRGREVGGGRKRRSSDSKWTLFN